MANPPLLIHKVHGKSIVLKNNFIATRPEGFNGGIIFSSRPIKVHETIYFKILKTSDNWSGSVKIGFTINDPITMKNSVPDCSCPDLVKIHGNWLKVLPEDLNVEGAIISFYVDMNGNVYYSADNRKTKYLLDGVKTSEKMWAVIDVYGNTVSIELFDPDSPVPKTKKNYINSDLTFHEAHFKSKSLPFNKSIACKQNCLSSHSYAFTNRPLKLRESVNIIVRKVDPSLNGLLEYGITSCDPSTIDSESLPQKTEVLLNWSEYWIVQEDICQYEVGDILTFEMNTEGKITVLRNNTCVSGFFYVDYTQPLWLFFKLSGQVTDISIKSVFEKTDADITEQIQDLTLSNVEESADSFKNSSSRECVICLENTVNCVLYRCGHMCLCIDCAVTLKTEFSRGDCPVCRKTIVDIIKVYK